MVGSSSHDAPIANAMTRTSNRLVSFTQPFSLSAIEGRQPPGSYTIETDEEIIASASFPAYRRIATWIRLPCPLPHPGAPAGLDRLINVDPLELDAALARDRAEVAAEAFSAPGRAPIQVDPPSGAAAMQTPARTRGPRATKFTVQAWLDANNSELTWIALVSLGLLVLGFLSSFDFAPR